MKNNSTTISVRDFQQRASYYLKNNSPITLTVYNKPVAQINMLNTSYAVNSVSSVADAPMIAPPEKIPPRAPNMSVKPVIDMVGVDSADIKSMVTFCMELFEQNVKQKCFRVSYEDINGNVLWTKWVCSKCLETLNDKIRRYGGKLRYDL